MKGPEGRYAWTVKMGEKGQIVIPKEARDVFGMKPGDTLLLLGDMERGLAIVDSVHFAELATKAMEEERGGSHDMGNRDKKPDETI